MVNTTRMSWVSVPQPNDEPAMLEQIQIGNITIHRIVEQEGAFFEALRFFRTLTKELLEEIGIGCIQGFSIRRANWCSASKVTSCRCPIRIS
jgi:hypothetical protein